MEFFHLVGLLSVQTSLCAFCYSLNITYLFISKPLFYNHHSNTKQLSSKC